MIVEEIMNQNVVTLHPNDTIETAIRTIRTKGDSAHSNCRSK